MKTLTIEHLAAYLPYGVKLMVGKRKCNIGYLSTKRIAFLDIKGFGEVEKIQWQYASGKIKPILRPLSDLTKEIEVDGEKFVPDLWFQNKNCTMFFEDDFLRGITRHNTEYDITQCSYNVVQKLLEWHFDIHGLIDAGLAVDMNSINQVNRQI